MKRYLPHIAIALILTVILVGGFGHAAHAQTQASLVACEITKLNVKGCVIDIMAAVMNEIMTIASWVLALSGTLLNFTMNLTLHIKEFVTNTPAIYTVWKAIRDISGMFIIFALLFAAVRMILAPVGVPGPNMGQLIKSVVVAGVLINFSFFVTGLGIDVSNIVSAQLYSTIAPASNINYEQLSGANGQKPEQLWKDGGISDIFMTALKITNIYDPKTANLVPQGAGGQPGIIQAPMQVILAGVFGTVVMITAAISFFLAALAFIVRFVILLLLLGFSPIWFASFAVPQLGPYAKQWTDTYKSQLTFMPVYLLLMYFALSILTTSNLFKVSFAQNLTAGGEWYYNFLILGVNAAIVIVMLNAPLLAAISLGAKMPKWAENVGAGAIWKKIGSPFKNTAAYVGGAAAGWAGRNTLGAAAANLDKAIGNTKYGNKLISRDIRAATLGKVAAGKYLGSRSYAENKKAQREVENKQGEITRAADLKELTNVMGPVDYAKVNDLVGKMNEKEKLAMGAENLIKPEILRNLKDSDFEAIKKDPDGNFTEQERNDIAKARKDLFKTSAENGDNATVKKMIENMKDDTKKSMASTREDALKSAVDKGHDKVIEELMKDMDGKELYKIHTNNPTLGLILRNKTVRHLTPSQLKKMSDEGLSVADKGHLKTMINGWPGGHRGAPTVNKPDWV